MSAAVQQLDIFEALRARDAGIAQAYRNADEGYSNRLFRAIEVLAASGANFTSDDARALAGDPPSTTSPNVAGAIFNAAAKAGLIEAVGFARSVRVVGHNNRVLLWKGCQRG